MANRRNPPRSFWIVLPEMRETGAIIRVMYEEQNGAWSLAKILRFEDYPDAVALARVITQQVVSALTLIPQR